MCMKHTEDFFIHFQTLRSGLKIARHSQVFLKPTSRCLGETLFRVFDVASQTIDNY